MKSFILMVIAMVCVVSLEAQNKSFYDFTVRTIDGKEFPLSSLKGKKVLVVNVASKCGLTPQYAKLQELYEKYKELAAGETNVIFGGRLGEYKYYDMDAVIASALALSERELA